MEFKFNVNDVLKSPIVEINQSLIPPGFTGDRRALWDAVTKISEVVDAMGDASAAAQGLTKPITTADRLRNSEQIIYLLVDRNAKNGKGVVTGMLKTGKKSLYIFDRDGQHYQVSPPCILDFYVHESRQRTGLGKQLFEHMLQKEQVEPVKLAVDRPSEKLLSFLNKHYGLNNALRQMNNYVVFDGFFPEIQTKELNGDSSNSNSPSKTKANGLQQNFTTPYGRYGAPRPHCSMGQIIHNQSPVQSNEPSGASLNNNSARPFAGVTQSAPVIQQHQDFSQSQTNVCQSVPNVWQQQQQQQQQQISSNNYGQQATAYYGQTNAAQQQYSQLQQPAMIQQQPAMIQQQPSYIQQQPSYTQQPLVQQPTVQQQTIPQQQPYILEQLVTPQQINSYQQQQNIQNSPPQTPYMTELHQQQLQLNQQRPASIQAVRNGMSPRQELGDNSTQEDTFSCVTDPYKQSRETSRIVSEPNAQIPQSNRNFSQPQFTQNQQTCSVPSQLHIQQPTTSTPRYNVQQFMQPIQGQQSAPIMPTHQVVYSPPLQSTPVLPPNQPPNVPQYTQQHIPPPNTEQPAPMTPNQNYAQPQANIPMVKAVPSTPNAALSYQYYDSTAGVMQTQYTYPPHQIVTNAPIPNAGGDMPPLQKSSEYYGQQASMSNTSAVQAVRTHIQMSTPHKEAQQQPTSPILNQDQSGQVSAHTIQPQGQLMKGEPRQSLEESVGQSPKLERPRSLSIQRSEEADNLDKQILNDIKSEAHSEANKAKDELDDIENDVEKITVAESAPQLHSGANDDAQDNDDPDRSKSPNPLTAQGFFDLKFYHSRLW